MFDSVEIASRLRQVMAEEPVTDEEFTERMRARSIGEERIAELLSGMGEPTVDTIRAAADALNVSSEWIAFGGKSVGLNHRLQFLEADEGEWGEVERANRNSRAERSALEMLIEKSFPPFRRLPSELQDSISRLCRGAIVRQRCIDYVPNRPVAGFYDSPNREEIVRIIGRSLSAPLELRGISDLDLPPTDDEISDFVEAMVPALRVLLRYDKTKALS